MQVDGMYVLTCALVLYVDYFFHLFCFWDMVFVNAVCFCFFFARVFLKNFVFWLRLYHNYINFFL